MSQAISNKVLVDTTNYCWMICDYTVSGTTLNYTLSFYYEKGCAQLDNAWIRLGSNIQWQDAGRIHNYEGVLSSPHTVAIHSGSFGISSGSNTITFGITKYNGVDVQGLFQVSGATPPTGKTVSVDSYTDTSVTLDVSITSWGDPVPATGKYIEGALCLYNTYSGNPRRWQKEDDVTEAFITVDNNSYTDPNAPLTIQGNTKYFYGSYATNTYAGTGSTAGTVVTLPAYITGVTVNDLTHHNIEFTVLHDAEGSEYTVSDEYSFDQVTWTPFFDSITVIVPTDRTVYFRRTSTAGVTPVYSVYVEPSVLGLAYGSVNNESKEIKKWYGSVNNQSKKIVKTYGSLNGLSKLIYEDLS